LCTIRSFEQKNNAAGNHIRAASSGQFLTEISHWPVPWYCFHLSKAWILRIALRKIAQFSCAIQLLVQLPFGVKTVTAYVVVPRAGAGFPKSAIPFLEGIRVQ